ncbi:MAG: hypothetical protein MZU97_12020 [Bacillus subtilis]|nr:hypothetical protein [Bacillus subtilis]
MIPDLALLVVVFVASSGTWRAEGIAVGFLVGTGAGLHIAGSPRLQRLRSNRWYPSVFGLISGNVLHRPHVSCPSCSSALPRTLVKALATAAVAARLLPLAGPRLRFPATGSLWIEDSVQRGAGSRSVLPPGAPRAPCSSRRGTGDERAPSRNEIRRQRRAGSSCP